ncbi:MAG: glycoside hydrolase family 27 protein [Bacteroidetes bacterium]|nr:glycoside hydrolase family 27 protein [Bacteroidota bacterium]
MKNLFLILFTLLVTQIQAQKFEGLALTPPMGWNSWNTFQTNINEELVKQTADLMVSSGMKDAGYNYIVLDDGWMAMERDSLTGDLVADPKKFPHGMKAVADYVHSKGLKFGLYNCAGTKTCQNYPGTRGYEYQDARLYASFDIDYLKFDWCNTKGINAKEAYTTMSMALKKAGRPMIFSVCEWGVNKPWEWAPQVGQLWRTTDDIYQVFDAMHNYGTWSAFGVMKILDLQDGLRKYAGPGHWNDPDMLEVGNGMRISEDRAHFSMWCMLAAPLMAGNDFRKMSKETLDIMTNKEAISINQDGLGIQGFKYSSKDSLEVWMKPLQNGNWAVCFLNRATNSKEVKFSWKDEIVSDSLSNMQLNAKTNIYKIRDVWTKTNLATTEKDFKAMIPSHDVLMLRLSK